VTVQIYGAYNPRKHYDPIVVDSLLQRYRVNGPAPADLIKACQILADRGYSQQEIADRLAVHTNVVWAALRRRIPLQPLPDIDAIPKCRKGLHDMVGDTVMVKKYRKNGNVHEWTTCRACLRESRRESRQKAS
jgi:hypothetical protein